MALGIRDITPLSVLDYPGRMACILWSGGCNMRCRYCYNPELLAPSQGDGPFPAVPRHNRVEPFLRERAGFLDGVVLSGGECTLNPHLPQICRIARDLGYSIKIDTNGSNPALIRQLIRERLVDYIALDYKAPPHLYARVTQSGQDLFRRFSQTLDLLIGLDFPFEVRTTIHTDLLDEQAVNAVIADLVERGYRATYNIQRYFHTGTTIAGLDRETAPFDLSLLSDALPINVRNA